ncbi:MAG TPA: hypothetical protein VH878_09625, partial [Thermodesulfobacteriota bacterium]
RDISPAIMIKDFSIAVYNDVSKSFSKLDANDLHIQPRKFYIFNIKSFNYAILNNAKLEIHFQAEEPSKIDFPFDKENLFLDNEKSVSTKIKSITELKINGLYVDIYANDRLFLKTWSEKAFINFLRSNEIEMRNSTLESVFAKKFIYSNLVIWDTKEKIFKIPGTYVAMTPQGRATGKGIKVHLDFTVQSLTRAESPARQQSGN